MTASLVLNNQLRFQGSAFYAMIGIASGAVINIVLDPIFIFVFHMGIGGAALATIISQFISFCLLIAGTRRGGNLRLDIRKFSPSLERYKIILNGGAPSLCRQGLGSVATACMNLMARPYGGRGHRGHVHCDAHHPVRGLGDDRLRPGLPAGLRLQLRGEKVRPGEGGLLVLRARVYRVPLYHGGLRLVRRGASGHHFPKGRPRT